MIKMVTMVTMVRVVRMVGIFYEVRLSRTCFLISRRRSKPQCGSINLCNPFARSAGIFLRRLTMFRVTQFSGSEFFGFRNPVSCELILARGIQL